MSDDEEDHELDRLAAELRLSPVATHSMGGTVLVFRMRREILRLC
jgi:hypothetical protein